MDIDLIYLLRVDGMCAAWYVASYNKDTSDEWEK